MPPASASSSNNNVVQGDWIGTNSTGTAAAANAAGIAINGSGNTIGGVGAGAANTIAFNTADGVQVASGTDNPIRGNSIYANGGLGIELGTSACPRRTSWAARTPARTSTRTTRCWTRWRIHRARARRSSAT